MCLLNLIYCHNGRISHSQSHSYVYCLEQMPNLLLKKKDVKLTERVIAHKLHTLTYLKCIEIGNK